MKRAIFNIFTTILFIGVIASSFVFSVSAEDCSCTGTCCCGSDGSGGSSNTVVFPFESATALSEYDSLTPVEFTDEYKVRYRTASASEGFQHYIYTKGLYSYHPKNPEHHLTFIPYFGSEWDSYNKTNINYIQIKFGIVYMSDSFNPSDDYLILYKNGEVLDSGYSISYQLSDVKEFVVAGVNYGYYNSLTCDIMFDDVESFSKTDIIGFGIKQYLLNFHDTDNATFSASYQIGVNDLVVGKLTTSQYLDRISGEIGAINDSLLKISEQLDKGLTPEQIQKIESNNQTVVIRKEYEDKIEDEYQEVKDQIAENGFDINDVDYNTGYENAAMAFNDSGLKEFSDTVWNSAWIVTAVSLVIAFSIIRLSLYGV